jgi:hypothetical protein
MDAVCHKLHRGKTHKTVDSLGVVQRPVLPGDTIVLWPL